MKLRAFFFLFFIMFYSYSHAADIYVQTGKGMTPLKTVMVENHVEVFKNCPYCFTIRTKDTYFSVNTQSEASIDKFLNFLYPEHIKIYIYFKKVQPNKQISFEYPLDTYTDKRGNAEIIMYSKPGTYLIKLMKNNQDVDKTKITLSSESNVNCIGIRPIRCKKYSS